MDQLLAATPMFWLVWLPAAADWMAVVLLAWAAAALVLAGAVWRAGSRNDEPEEG